MEHVVDDASDSSKSLESELEEDESEYDDMSDGAQMYCTTDESSSDNDEFAVDSDDGEVCVSESQTTHSCPLLVEPPQVLDPSHYIMKVPGPRRECFGYRICGDNIDKNVRARYMRSDLKKLVIALFSFLCSAKPH